MSCDLSIVSLVTYEGSAFIVLFLDMRNMVSSHFLTVCTVQVSVLVSATKRTSIEGHVQFSCDFSLQLLGCRHVRQYW